MAVQADVKKLGRIPLGRRMFKQRYLQPPSDAEFDTIMANYLTTRVADGYNDVLTEQQRQLDLNMQKIANLPNK